MENKFILEWLNEDSIMEDKDIFNLNVQEIKRVKPEYKLSALDIKALSTFLKDYKYNSTIWKYDSNTKKHYFLLDYEMIFKSMNNLSSLNEKSYYKAINNEIGEYLRNREVKENGK